MAFRITVKFAVATSLILLAAMSLLALLSMGTLRRLVMEEAASDADQLSETLLKATHHHMLENDRRRIAQVMEEVGTQKGIRHIRFINKNGIIRYSTDPAEVGQLLDKRAAACTTCHAGTSPLVHAPLMNRSRIFTGADGKQLLGLAKAIYNEPVCSSAACHVHNADTRVLGVLDVIVTLDTTNQLLDSFRHKIAVLTFSMLLVIWGSLTFLTQRIINAPVRRLLDHTLKVGKGDLDTVVLIHSKDELGELTAAFNEMTVNLRRARGELEEWGKRLEEKVEERTEELRHMQVQLIHTEKLASLGELVAGIAHEINNPLTGILVYGSLIQKDQRLNDALKGDISVIVRETERCAGIVRRLLDFSRSSVPCKQPVSLNSIVEAALELMEQQSLFHNVEIVRGCAKDIPEIEVDPNQIEQVLINILINGGQAMDGVGQLTITTGKDDEEGIAFVIIADTGCGIPSDNLTKIFDPFFTTKENKGTGLGLSVSYGIITNHGGEIRVESTIGEGTVFTVELPLPGREPAETFPA